MSSFFRRFCNLSTLFVAKKYKIFQYQSHFDFSEIHSEYVYGNELFLGKFENNESLYDSPHLSSPIEIDFCLSTTDAKFSQNRNKREMKVQSEWLFGATGRSDIYFSESLLWGPSSLNFRENLLKITI